MYLKWSVASSNQPSPSHLPPKVQWDRYRRNVCTISPQYMFPWKLTNRYAKWTPYFKKKTMHFQRLIMLGIYVEFPRCKSFAMWIQPHQIFGKLIWSLSLYCVNLQKSKEPWDTGKLWPSYVHIGMAIVETKGVSFILLNEGILLTSCGW